MIADTILYGMTQMGGVNGDGCVFSIDTNGNGYKKLLDFNDTNGKQPLGNLTAIRGQLYGMTEFGSVHSIGCVFSIDTNGSGYTKRLVFNGSNGSRPQGTLTLSGNLLYGMTVEGGTNNAGVIFKMDTNNIDKTLNVVDELRSNKAVVTLYPNPSNGVFQIQANSQQLMANSRIEVYNALGQKVYAANINAATTQIDLSNQAAGVYLYKVITETGGLIGEGKLMIEK